MSFTEWSIIMAVLEPDIILLLPLIRKLIPGLSLMILICIPSKIKKILLLMPLICCFIEKKKFEKKKKKIYKI